MGSKEIGLSLRAGGAQKGELLLLWGDIKNLAMAPTHNLICIILCVTLTRKCAATFIFVFQNSKDEDSERTM